MRILITGVCGFVGSILARVILEKAGGELFGIDNLSRAGSEINRTQLRSIGVQVFHGDVRAWGDFENLPAADWVIDAAANPSVLAGVDGKSTSRQLVEHNLIGTLNVLEYCKRHRAGFTLLSTSRVYSIPALAGIPIRTEGNSFVLDATQSLPRGVSSEGITEEFSTAAPLSLYGSTKLASEVMGLEYGAAFGFPVWVDRCGVLAGAGQFATVEQGVFSYWMHAHAARRPLRYIGFGGQGLQARDAFHPEDLADLVLLQMADSQTDGERIYNVGGGLRQVMSLAHLTEVCNSFFGEHVPVADLRPRPFDIPWVVMDSSRTKRRFGWEPKRGLSSILNEIAEHVRTHPGWLEMCQAS